MKGNSVMAEIEKAAKKTRDSGQDLKITGGFRERPVIFSPWPWCQAGNDMRGDREARQHLV